MSNKFKVGDEVECWSTLADDNPNGLKGTVVAVEDGQVEVAFPGWTEGHSGKASEGNDRWYFWPDNSNWDEEYIKLVEKPKKAKASKAKQTYKGNGKHTWELVIEGTVRLRVPGGWLYRDTFVGGTTFVPVPEVVGHVI